MAAGIALMWLGLTAVGLPLLVALGPHGGPAIEAGPAISVDARADVPAPALSAYRSAAARCPGLPWTVLAAIGKVESDHGRSTLPGVRSGTNFAGAAGPMQFLAPSWAAYGRDGNGDGVRDVYDIADAAHGAAAYLCANRGGSANRLRSAIRSYNHSDSYVAEVLAIAARYGASRGAPVGAPSGGALPRALGGFVFPVATTDTSFTNDYQSIRGSGGHCPDHPTWHCATDMFAPKGTPVLAPIAGRVTRAGYQRLGGNRLWIEGPDDRFYLAHLQEISPGIREGAQVAAGQVVGLLGDTGSARGTPPHLHIAWERRTAGGSWLNANPYELLRSFG